MAGKRTVIAVGGLEIEVSLAPTSSDPKGAKWETRTVGPDGEPLATASLADRINSSAPVSPALTAAVEIPAGAEVGVNADGDVEPIDDPLGDRQPEPEPPAAIAEPEPGPKVQRGVTTDDGVFVDLTERLAKIDEEVEIKGMEIVAAIGAHTVPRERVRGACYVTPVDPEGKRACAMLYSALSEAGLALVARWTKRTNQAVGIVTGSKAHRCLLLLEVEFAANMKAPPKGALVESVVGTLTDGERSAAALFIESVAGRKADLDAVVDERRARQAELLEAAREGTLGGYDEAHEPAEAEVDEFEAEFAAIVAAQA